MISLFLGITAVNILSLVATILIGFSAATHPALKGWHLLAGVLATFVCIGAHCIVFTYFIATAKWIQHAVTVKQLDPAYTQPTRSFKAQAFPAGLIAMCIVFATAILGAAHDNYFTPRAWHRWCALIALAINLVVAVMEYRAIARNARLIDDILATIHRPQSATTP